ncbi:MAG TPA: DUF72 domain-containing protein [Methylomirabilota bacterium]|nr:DUF72 domain-containing protein [Methylomirabilota bacterium]
MALPDNLYLGTVSWSKLDWVGSFYPANLKPAEFLETYARSFRTVEIDSTFYRIPTSTMVTAWRNRTPQGFLFAAKVPQVITHAKRLSNCDEEFSRFLRIMEPLGDKLGPLLLQFPYFNKNIFASREPFDKLLRSFFKSLPKGFRFALEIRNKNWISWDFLELLREHSVGFALLDQAWMPRIDTLAQAVDLVTGDFCYVRFMGDRKGLESKTEKFDQIIEDKTEDMKVWAEEIKKIVAKGTPTYTFFSNYYAGYGPGSARLFEEIWENI